MGLRLRERRVALGLTGHQFAELIGVSYQQAYKYERGINRMSAGRLYAIAAALETPLTYFYDEFDADAVISPRQRTTLDIARNFVAIEDEKHQAAFGHVVRLLADR